MVEANVKIISELKSIIHHTMHNSALCSLFTKSKDDFTRTRKLTFERLVYFILNLPKRSLSLELSDFFDSIGEPSCITKSAFSQQRTKLLPLFFKVLNASLVQGFYNHYGNKVKRWRGFRLLAVDGSTAFLVDKPDVVEYYGTQRNQHSYAPMARVMQTYDVLNELIVHSSLHHIKTGEQSIITKNIQHLFEDSITLFDRGFPSYELMYLMMNQEKPRHFVIRCKVDFNNEIKTFMNSKRKDTIVEITPTAYAIKSLYSKGFIISTQTKLKVRAVKVKLSTGATEVLLTNLFNKKEFTINDLKYLYGLRWGIETVYGLQKNQLQLEQFSGHRVICIQQDFEATMFVKNLQSIIQNQCEETLENINQMRKHNYKINHNVSIGALKNNIIKLFVNEHPNEILKQLEHIFVKNIEPIRNGRAYKRVFKIKYKRGKYRTLTNYKRAA
jgi:Transposase DDE domain